MKKKWIIIISSALVLIGAVILLIVLLTGNKLDKCTKYLNKSMEEAVSISATTTIKDQDLVVYQYIKSIEKGDKITVTETVKEYNSSFQLKETTEVTEVESFDSSSLLSINLSKDVLSDYEFKNNILSFDLSKEELMKVLNTKEISASQNAHLEFKFDNKKIHEIMINFTTESGKSASVVITYRY